MPDPRFAFGPYVYDPATATLWRDATLVPIGGKGAAVLETLLNADGGVVTKSDLMERAWPGTIVEDGNLAVQVATLRKTLGTTPEGEEWIGTVARVGYRLARDTPAGAAAGKPSIAVLPFLNMSSDPDQDYFADGMVEDLTTALSRFRTFSVVSRQSSFSYRERPIDIRDVARGLGARYLLEGSVRRNGNNIRVNTQLIEGATGAHLWAEKLDGRLEDIFDFQDRITSSVIGLIEPHIRRAEIERARRKRPDSLDAYDFYLQGLAHFIGVPPHTVESHGIAIDRFDKALQLDPHYVPALTLAAWAREKRQDHGGSPPGARDREEAIALSERAYAGDPNDAMAVLVAGVVHLTIKDDTETAIGLLRRAAELNPHSTVILNTTGYGHVFRGEFDEAIALYHRSLQITVGSAESFWARNGIARAHLAAGHFEEALTWGLRALEVSDTQDGIHCTVAAAYAHLGQMDRATAAVKLALQLEPALTVARAVGPKGKPGTIDRHLAEGLAKAGLRA